MREGFKPSIALKGAMKDLDYVYDFIKNMQKTKQLGKKLEAELNKKTNKIDIDLARSLISEMNDYLQAANIARGKVKDVLAVIANVIQKLERRNEALQKARFFEAQVPDEFETIMKMLLKPGIRIVNEKIVERDDGSKLYYVVLEGRNGRMKILFDSRKGVAYVTTDFIKDPLLYNGKKLSYNLTSEKDLEDLEYLAFYLNKEDVSAEEVFEAIERLIDQFENVEMGFEEDGCELIDEKTTEDGIKVELVKCGNKYIIFLNNDQKYGVYDDELEARNDFNDF